MMTAIRRIGAILVVLLIGIFLGFLGWKNALLVVAPLILLWLMSWDEKRYRNFEKEQYYQEHYAYRK